MFLFKNIKKCYGRVQNLNVINLKYALLNFFMGYNINFVTINKKETDIFC